MRIFRIMISAVDLPSSLDPLARVFRALGDETRLRIVALLAGGELCVCHVVAALELPQPTVSRHLAVLRGASLVRHRRDGAWMHYRLTEPSDPAAAAVVRALVGALSTTLRAEDLDRLRRSTGPGACE